MRSLRKKGGHRISTADLQNWAFGGRNIPYVVSVLNCPEVNSTSKIKRSEAEDPRGLRAILSVLSNDKRDNGILTITKEINSEYSDYTVAMLQAEAWGNKKKVELCISDKQGEENGRIRFIFDRKNIVIEELEIEGESKVYPRMKPAALEAAVKEFGKLFSPYWNIVHM